MKGESSKFFYSEMRLSILKQEKKGPKCITIPQKSPRGNGCNGNRGRKLYGWILECDIKKPAWQHEVTPKSWTGY